MKTIGLICFLLLAFPSTDLALAATPILEDAFSPHQGASDLIIKTIANARESIDVAAYSFTSMAIAEALINAHRKGIEVRVVLDKSRNNGIYTRFMRPCEAE